MVKAFSIDYSILNNQYRFEPQYYYYTYAIKDNLNQKGYTFDKLKNLAKVISDGEHSHIPRIDDENGVRYLYGRNIKEGIINFDPITDLSYITKENYENYKRVHINENDVLLTIVGTVGKSALYKSEYVGLAGIPRHIARIELKKNIAITPEYLSVYFRSRLGKHQLLSIKTGNIQPLIALKNLKEVEIPIPSKDIVEKYTQLENEMLNCEIQALKLINQAQEIFTNELNLSYEKRKHLAFSVNFSDIQDEDIWTPYFSNPLFLNTEKQIKQKFKTVKLGEIATFKRGHEPGSSSYIPYTEAKKTDIPFIRTTDIVNFECDLFPDFFIPVEYADEFGQDIQEGDILFTKDGKIGETAMILKDEKVLLASGITEIRLKKQNEITPEYIFIVLTNKFTGYYPAIKRTIVGTTIPHLREERAKDILIPLIDKEKINVITEKIKQAFILKRNKKDIFRLLTNEFEKLKI